MVVTGTMVETLGHDAYLVKIHGSNRLSQRNRQFLRRLTPYKCDVDDAAVPNMEPVLHVQAPDPLVDVPLQQHSPMAQPPNCQPSVPEDINVTN